MSQDPDKALHTPRIIAHRGASYRCPENTLKAFDKGLAEDADGFELDLQLTRDGVPVVFHDQTLSKLGNRHKRIAQVPLADLKAMDAGAWFDWTFAGEQVPTLAEVLSRYAGRTEICLEIKPTEGRTGTERHAELVRQTVDMIRGAGAKDQVYLLCFDSEWLQFAYRLAPELRMVLNAVDPVEALAAAAGMPWLFAIDVDIRRLQPEQGRALHERGRKLMSYTCDTDAELRRALAAGVDYIISNQPARTRQFLQGQASR